MGPVWQRLADIAAGTVTGLVLARAADAQPVVFAASPTGVHVSLDGGRSWRRTSDDLAPVLVGAVAASPAFARDRTLFAAARAGMYRSHDAGRTWDLRLGGPMLSVAVSPQYASTPSVVVGTEADGILASHDGGSTWVSANPGLRASAVSALAMSPAFETDGTALAGTPAGLYVTRNSAKSWRSIELDCDDPATECLAVASDFARSGVMLVGTASGGLWRSTDRGSIWNMVLDLDDESITAIACGALSSRCWVVTAGGLAAVSDDGGATWRTIHRLPGLALSLGVVEDDVLVAGLLHAGVVRSVDGGASWKQPDHALPANLLTHLVCSPAFVRDRTLFAAGLDSGVLVSRDAGATWTECASAIEGLPVLSLDVSTGVDRTLYAGTTSGLFRSPDLACDWEPARGFQHVSQVATVASGTLVLVMADGDLAHSVDAGSTWRVLQVPFAAMDISALAPLTARDARQGVLVATWSATRHMREVWCSRDWAERWERIFTSPGDAPLVLARQQSVDGPFVVGDGQCLCHVPEGRTASLPATITALAWARDWLVAATTAGVYVSRDAGYTFTKLAADGPGVVMTLALSPEIEDRRLYALELGGTVWTIRLVEGETP